MNPLTYSHSCEHQILRENIIFTITSSGRQSNIIDNASGGESIIVNIASGGKNKIVNIASGGKDYIVNTATGWKNKIVNIASGGKVIMPKLPQEGKMNSSKSMVQAVTLLTALRMFTNGKLVM